MNGARVRRALVSTFDKEGVVDLCRSLESLGIEILSTGGTARLLLSSGVRVRRVSEYTRFPEMLDGRVKTLHPAIHAGILAIRSNPGHVEDLQKAGIEPIDLVVVNLYPFEKTSRTEGASLEEIVEMIDIGGPTMIRAAAKNHAHVGVVVERSDYARVAAEIREAGGLKDETRFSLAAKAFRHTAAYDAAVASYLTRVSSEEAGPRFPEDLRLDFDKVLDLVYGENPHQAAAFYRDPASQGVSLATASQLQGKALSFNNILDFDACLALAADLERGACVIVKHGNPCGVALGEEPALAFQRALDADPVSAFGGVVAFTDAVDAAAAEAVSATFFEGVIAPDVAADAREILARKKNLRVLTTGSLASFRRDGLDLRRVTGGLLAQEWDDARDSVRESKVASQRAPTEEEWRALEFAWRVVRHVKSNAIVYATSDRTVGIGAGQMSRVDSARFGIQKARQPLRGAVMASDAFFPFRDGIDVAAEAGVTAVVQPGGSIRDQEVIAAVDEHAMAMVLVGHRHFRH